jgi:putative nucleotidyltransferase with HDIG domain
MNSISLKQVTENVKDLPTLPEIVMELLNSLENDDINIQLLAQKVTHDSALTAKTLRYANSAYYSTLIKVTTIQQAISLMGISTVKQIIMTAAMSGCFPENNCAGFSHKAFWQHSNAVAIAAKLLAKRLNFHVDVAFTAGLLHDIGTLVLVTQYPQQYAATLVYKHEHHTSQFDAERHVLGIDHAAVGAALATEWNFSDIMKNAIGGHHQPDTAGIGFLATIIHVADGIAHALTDLTSSGTSAAEISALSWKNMSLDPESIEKLIHDTAAELAQIGADDV